MAEQTLPELPRTRRQKIQAFLRHYADTCRVTMACELAGIGRQTHYNWLATDPEYVKAFGEAKCLAADYIEAEMVRRGVDGWNEDVFYQGAKCGTVTRYSDGLLMLLARGMMPDKYGPVRSEITGPTALVQAKIEVVFVKPDEPQES